jgi:hypothetical protein
MRGIAFIADEKIIENKRELKTQTEIETTSVK